MFSACGKASRARALVGKCQRCSPARKPSPLRAVSEDVGQIDPTTGELVVDAEARGPRPRDAVQAGGLKLAYRMTPGRGDAKPPVLLLHGIGSNSYCWRELMSLLSDAGHTCYAPDLVGHGGSDKPSPSQFAYDEASYLGALDAFVKAVDLKGPYHVVVHGYVLGQYGMLWALNRASDISRMVVINVPVGRDSKLRPELAAYKNPMAFMRPKPESKFAGDIYNASGLAFVINYNDAQAYDLPYQEDVAASVAVAATMDKCDWKGLLNKVDQAYCTWRVPTALLYGNADPFLDVRDAMKFLDTKRTTMQLLSIEGKLGHMPQEDNAGAFDELLARFFAGGDVSVRGVRKVSRKDILTSDV